MVRFGLLALGIAAMFLSSEGLAQRFGKDQGLDINDVAVLFPLDANDQLVPSISLAQTAGQGNLLTSALLSEVTTQATIEWMSSPQGSNIMRLENWAVVAFRYDPCAPSNDREGTTCIRELRLVAQPLSNFGPADSALHLVYKLGEGLPSANDPLVTDLVALKRESESLLKISTAGLPLGVHPLLQASVNQSRSDVPLLFQNFLLKHAKASKLHKITMMGLRDGSPIDWIFMGGNVVNGHWQPVDVPNLGAGKISTVELNLSGTAEVFSPVTADPSLSTEDFFNSNPAGVKGSMDLLNHAVHALENPMLSNRNTVDCVSCHTATSIRLDNNFKFLPHIEGITANIPARVTAFPAPMMLGAHPTHWNIRALGYFGIQPTLTMRTVHEAANNVVQLNKILGLSPAGPDCTAVAQAVMSCFVKSSTLFGTATPTETCLKSCKP